MKTTTPGTMIQMGAKVSFEGRVGTVSDCVQRCWRTKTRWLSVYFGGLQDEVIEESKLTVVG